MRSTLASASRGLGELKSKELEGTIGVNITRWHSLGIFSGRPVASLALDQPNRRHKGILSPGLARSAEPVRAASSGRQAPVWRATGRLAKQIVRQASIVITSTMHKQLSIAVSFDAKSKDFVGRS
jgi:hypothetical protein